MSEDQMKPKTKFACSKCGCEQYVVGEIRGPGGKLASMFEVDNERFSYIACQNCKFTEFYRTELKKLDRVLDFLIG